MRVLAEQLPVPLSGRLRVANSQDGADAVSRHPDFTYDAVYFRLDALLHYIAQTLTVTGSLSSKLDNKLALLGYQSDLFNSFSLLVCSLPARVASASAMGEKKEQAADRPPAAREPRRRQSRRSLRQRGAQERGSQSRSASLVAPILSEVDFSSSMCLHQARMLVLDTCQKRGGAVSDGGRDVSALLPVLQEAMSFIKAQEEQQNQAARDDAASQELVVSSMAASFSSAVCNIKPSWFLNATVDLLVDVIAQQLRDGVESELVVAKAHEASQESASDVRVVVREPTLGSGDVALAQHFLALLQDLIPMCYRRYRAVVRALIEISDPAFARYAHVQSLRSQTLLNDATADAGTS
jgi:hypothetical protein